MNNYPFDWPVLQMYSQLKSFKSLHLCPLALFLFVCAGWSEIPDKLINCGRHSCSEIWKVLLFPFWDIFIRNYKLQEQGFSNFCHPLSPMDAIWMNAIQAHEYYLHLLLSYSFQVYFFFDLYLWFFSRALDAKYPYTLLSSNEVLKAYISFMILLCAIMQDFQFF